MKEQKSIPTTKVARASKFIKTGAKVGSNYLKHYTKKILTGEADKEALDASNASDIYGSLSELKGSALKVAQMLAMDKNLLPKAYQNQFALSQYSAPPLSYPLVVKTFHSFFGKGPNDLFDSFSKSAVNAASIGQVHKAESKGKKLAVKVQYPGVAESVKSDLKLVKPFALRLFNINERELDQYMEEVEQKLLEETDYTLELKRSIELVSSCRHLKGLFFPEYHPEFSSQRILTMDWLEGKHLSEFLKQNPSQEIKNKVGQSLWDFYHFQIHELKTVHADPHPGNFLITDDGSLGVIDFGCVKEIPADFYVLYFQLMREETVLDEEVLTKALTELSFLYADDSQEEKVIFTQIFKEMTLLLGRPFHSDTFDFGHDAYFRQIYDLSERLSKMKVLRESKHPRGSRHGLYINRTYFGLYTLLNELQANIRTTKPEWIQPAELMV